MKNSFGFASVQDLEAVQKLSFNTCKVSTPKIDGIGQSIIQPIFFDIVDSKIGHRNYTPQSCK